MYQNINKIMKKIIFLIVFTSLAGISFADNIHIPSGSCMTMPAGSNVCADTITVDAGGCFIAADSSCICPGIVFRGGGIIIIAVNQIGISVPTNYELYQNYPNPFNPTTKIRFDIPSNLKRETSNVRMIIYDILGREAAVLVNESLKPGTYEAEWNASNYPSGVYYYKLQTEDYTEAKKMILVK